MEEDNRIKVARNSVGPGFGPGKDNPIALHTSESSVYRVTGVNQIQDIIECGYVRPKGHGARRDRVGDIIYWASGNDKLHYISKKPVIEAPADKVLDGQIGAIPIEDLTAIWMFDEVENKYVNRLRDIRLLHQERKEQLKEKIIYNEKIK
ncbi:MAG: hypothetical protein II119_04650 [Bacilli bacterium]|nr:hypothetical protein [Bacilli bacterium]MBQ6282638.1 hypothetical protein [Bacilli bacterium]